MPDTLKKKTLVERKDLCNIGYGILRETGTCSGQLNVANSSRVTRIAGKRNADHRPNATAIEHVALNHYHGPPETRFGALRRWQVSPVDVALDDYHSSLVRIRLAASATKASSSGSAASGSS